MTINLKNKNLPISGTLVTVCKPGLFLGDFSKDGADLLHRSSGIPGLDFEDVTEAVLMLFRT